MYGIRLQNNVWGGGGGGVGKESVIFKSLGQCSENFLFNQVANERAVSD